MQQNANCVRAIFGAQVAARRTALGLTQESLAEKVGISQESLSRMEKGQIGPRIERLRDFALALDCRISDLFQEPGQEPSKSVIDAQLDRLPDAIRARAMAALIEVVETVLLASKSGDESRVNS